MTDFEDPDRLHALLLRATAAVDSPDLPVRALEAARRRRHLRRRRAVTAAGAAGAAALVIVAWLGLSLPSHDQGQAMAPSVASSTAPSHPAYKVNRFGLTVGPVLVSTPPSEWPDLRAIRFHGHVAYLRVRSTVTRPAKTPRQALAHMRRMCRQGLLDDRGRIWAKVYEADGRTVLGRLLAGRTSAHC